MTDKNFRALPDYDQLVAKWLDNYDDANYEGGLAASVLRRTHSLIEKTFPAERHVSKVLELGAGTLAHLPFVRHSFDQYIASDFDELVVARAREQVLPDRVELKVLDGAALPFDDSTFDRLIATHVLEHVPAPHLALEEWIRVLKPGGTLSLILPCDPGMAWRLGRYFGPRKQAQNAGLPYDYYMAREHVNSIFSLHQILSYHFPDRDVTWWPSRIPLADINLIYAGNFRV